MEDLYLQVITRLVGGLCTKEPTKTELHIIGCFLISKMNLVPAVLTDVVQGIALLGPGGAIPLDPHSIVTPDMLYGAIDTSSGQWNYDSEFSASNTYIANFSSDLAEGSYTLAITDTDGVLVSNDTPSVYYNGVVELPEISSKSFRVTKMRTETFSGSGIRQRIQPFGLNLLMCLFAACLSFLMVMT